MAWPAAISLIALVPMIVFIAKLALKAGKWAAMAH